MTDKPRTSGDNAISWSYVMPTPKAGEPPSILTEAQRLVYGERGDQYGPPEEDFGRTAALASILLAGKLSAPLTAKDVALIQVCVKLSRETHRHKPDNLIDAAGYLEGAYICERKSAESQR